MSAARAQGQDVLVTFGAHSGCFDGRRYSRSRVCRAPSASAYRAAVRRFDNRYPWVRTYSAWNEVNHISQPTFTRPRLAVRYYRVLLRESRRRRFRVLAADVLDTANMHRYLREFLRHAPGRPRLWGLHNYQDVNNGTSFDTRVMLETVPGEVWMTETNGIVAFEGSGQWPYSESRAAQRTRWMFRLAERYDSRRRGMRSRITGVFVYNWFGAPPGARFDSGLVDPDGTPRAAYFVVRAYARSTPLSRRAPTRALQELPSYASLIPAATAPTSSRSARTSPASRCWFAASVEADTETRFPRTVSSSTSTRSISS